MNGASYGFSEKAMKLLMRMEDNSLDYSLIRRRVCTDPLSSYLTLLKKYDSIELEREDK